MNEILFPGAGAIALDTYIKTQPVNNYFIKIIKKITNFIIRRKYGTVLKTFKVDGDVRFDIIKSIFESYHAGVNR